MTGQHFVQFDSNDLGRLGLDMMKLMGFDFLRTT
jgi:hypothetical protein